MIQSLSSFKVGRDYSPPSDTLCIDQIVIHDLHCPLLQVVAVWVYHGQRGVLVVLCELP